MTAFCASLLPLSASTLIGVSWCQCRDAGGGSALTESPGNPCIMDGVPSPPLVSVCGRPGGREALEVCLRNWNSRIQFLAVPGDTLA